MTINRRTFFFTAAAAMLAGSAVVPAFGQATANAGTWSSQSALQFAT